jgi:ketosteroid isomerase-like protein
MRSKVAFVVFFTIIIHSSCTNSQADSDKAVADLKQTEINFSNASVQKGMGMAFVEYADTNVVKLNDGNFPVIGKAELSKIYSKDKSHFPFTLQWKPEKAEVATSGDIGYTYGNWEMKAKTLQGKDTTYYGNYITVWKKQKNGSWKFVIDGGNSTPKPMVK